MYTTEEIQNNYEFKVIRRILKKEFPYIKDMRLTSNWDEYKSLFFVVIDINLYELLQSLGIPITKSSTKYIDMWSHEEGHAYLTSYFPSSMGEVIRELSKQMQSTINKIQESKTSIPLDMKLPREISISSWKSVGQVDIT